MPFAQDSSENLPIYRIQLRKGPLHQYLALGCHDRVPMAGRGKVALVDRLAEPGASPSAQVGVGDVPRHRGDKCRQLPGFAKFTLTQGFQNTDKRIMQEIARSFPVLRASTEDSENAGAEVIDQFSFGLPISSEDPFRQTGRPFSVTVLHGENAQLNTPLVGP